MIGKKRIICVIPARLDSTRFPRKILAPLGDKPLIQWVWEAAKKIRYFDQVVVAIDAEETAHALAHFGAHFEFTPEDCQSGSDRLIHLNRQGKFQADIWVNWQADEPFIDQKMIEDLLGNCEHEQSDIWTLYKRVPREEALSPHVVKVVRDIESYALYFSRSPIPCFREEREEMYLDKHVGLYAFTADALNRMARLESCELERIEQLEQLRFLYHNLRILVKETKKETLGIDTPEQLNLAQRLI